MTATCNSIGKDAGGAIGGGAQNATLVPGKEKKQRHDSTGTNGRTSRASSTSSFTSFSPAQSEKHSRDARHNSSSDVSVKRESLDSIKDIASSPTQRNGIALRDKQNGDVTAINHSSPVADAEKAGAGDKIKGAGGALVSANKTPVSFPASPLHSNGYDSDRKLAANLYLSTLSPAAAFGHLPLPPLGGYTLPAPHVTSSGVAAASEAASAAALLAAHKAAAHHHSTKAVMKYQTIRTVGGGTTVVPVCSDLYCTHCKLTIQAAQLGATTPGSSTAAPSVHHDKALALPAHYAHAAAASLSAAGLFGGLSALPGYPGAAGMTSPAASGNSLLTAPPTAAAAGDADSCSQPYVCSWMASTGVCGKRFAYSDDLMQHLRTHTTALDDAHAPSAAAAALAGGGYSSLPPNFTSAALLRQAYDSRLSALNLLSSSSSASRYHPYMKSLTSLHGRDAAALSAMHPATALGPYASLYSLYGHKLGVP